MKCVLSSRFLAPRFGEKAVYGPCVLVGAYTQFLVARFCEKAVYVPCVFRANLDSALGLIKGFRQKQILLFTGSGMILCDMILLLFSNMPGKFLLWVVAALKFIVLV